MKRHQRIAPLFNDEFWGTRIDEVRKKEVHRALRYTSNIVYKL